MRQRLWERIIKGSMWAFIAMIDLAILALLGYMLFGWVFEIASFHQMMNMLAG